MNRLNLKAILLAGSFVFALISCHSGSKTTNMWDSSGKHTMPADSTINKIDISPSAPLVDTVKMMHDTSQH